MSQSFEFAVNGKPARVTLDNQDTPLLDVLRTELGLMGTRFGCGLEQCGCCMVLIDGQPEKACARPIFAVAGKSVTTIEGLGTADKPHPLQQAFLDEQAGQCGYCLSGIIVVGQGAARPQSGADARRRSPKRSTATSAAAAATTASCARWRKPRRR